METITTIITSILIAVTGFFGFGGEQIEQPIDGVGGFSSGFSGGGATLMNLVDGTDDVIFVDSSWDLGSYDNQIQEGHFESLFASTTDITTLTVGSCSGCSGDPDVTYTTLGATTYYTASTTATDNLSWLFQNGFISTASSTFSGNATTTGNHAFGSIRIPTLTSALLQTDANGLASEYAGTTCTNQFTRALSVLGIATCETVDITSDTNLVAGTYLDFAGDTLNFDSTLVDAVTWSDGANASNIWTFDVSGTDTTMTAGDDVMTFSNDLIITGAGTSTSFAVTGKTLTVDGDRIYHGVGFLTNSMSEDKQDITIRTAAGDVYIDVEKTGGGDIEYIFDEVEYTLDATTGGGIGGKATVLLTEGTATTPVLNYLYVATSSPTAVTLTASTTLPNGQGNFVWVGMANIQSDTEVDADEALLFQRMNEALKHDGRGKVSEMAEKLRFLGAEYISGIDQTLTIGIEGATLDTVDLTTNTGGVYQLHRQTWAAFDSSTDGIWVANASGAGVLTNYQKLTDLNQAFEDTAGNAITNNKRYILTIWCAMNSANQQKCFVNLPTGTYSSDANALADTDNKAVTTIPPEFKTTGFLLAKVVLKYTTASSGTITNLSGGTAVQDLRGLSAGFNLGGAGGSSSNVFSDALFRINDDGDATRQLGFQASGITTGTLRTVTAQDADGTMCLLESAQTFTAHNIFSSLFATIATTTHATTTSQYITGLGTPAGTFLAVDPNGQVIATTTASHDAVTLAGQDYLTLSGQQITAGEIEPDDLASSDFGEFTCNGTTCVLEATNTTLTTLANVTTIGTIGTGIWQSTDVALAYGGTNASAFTANQPVTANGAGDTLVSTSTLSSNFLENIHEKSFTISSTSKDHFSQAQFSTATTTWLIWTPFVDAKLHEFNCTTNKGNVAVEIGDGISSTTALQAAFPTATSTPNKQFLDGNRIFAGIGSSISDADMVACTTRFIE